MLSIKNNPQELNLMQWPDLFGVLPTSQQSPFDREPPPCGLTVDTSV